MQSNFLTNLSSSCLIWAVSHGRVCVSVLAPSSRVLMSTPSSNAFWSYFWANPIRCLANFRISEQLPWNYILCVIWFGGRAALESFTSSFDTGSRYGAHYYSSVCLNNDSLVCPCLPSHPPTIIDSSFTQLCPSQWVQSHTCDTGSGGVHCSGS